MKCDRVRRSETRQLLVEEGSAPAVRDGCRMRRMLGDKASVALLSADTLALAWSAHVTPQIPITIARPSLGSAVIARHDCWKILLKVKIWHFTQGLTVHAYTAALAVRSRSYRCEEMERKEKTGNGVPRTLRYRSAEVPRTQTIRVSVHGRRKHSCCATIRLSSGERCSLGNSKVP